MSFYIRSPKHIKEVRFFEKDGTMLGTPMDQVGIPRHLVISVNYTKEKDRVSVYINEYEYYEFVFNSPDDAQAWFDGEMRV